MGIDHKGVSPLACFDPADPDEERRVRERGPGAVELRSAYGITVGRYRD
ncbi:hypothetical protein ACO0M4_23440 [Streptomyces sp. RGM 3693]